MNYQVVAFVQMFLIGCGAGWWCQTLPGPWYVNLSRGTTLAAMAWVLSFGAGYIAAHGGSP